MDRLTRRTAFPWSLALCFVLLCALATAAPTVRPVDLAAWARQPSEFQGATVASGSATLASDRWAYLLSPDEYEGVQIEAVVTLREPAKQFQFFGESWSVWPDPTYGDQGYEAALLLRAGKEHGYRVQWSHRYQDLALVKYPDGGYLRAVPCAVKLNEAQRISVSLEGAQIVVRVDGQEKIRCRDEIRPLLRGRVGIGASSGAKVAFESVSLRPLSPAPGAAPGAGHTPGFAVRKWIGGRQWVFDGDEPVMLLHTARETSINSVKLRPGYKPQLSWNSHWDIQNQGAYAEGENRPSDPAIVGGGKTLTAS
jgi:hypothetical protein